MIDYGIVTDKSLEPFLTAVEYRGVVCLDDFASLFESAGVSDETIALYCRCHGLALFSVDGTAWAAHSLLVRHAFAGFQACPDPDADPLDALVDYAVTNLAHEPAPAPASMSALQGHILGLPSATRLHDDLVRHGVTREGAADCVMLAYELLRQSPENVMAAITLWLYHELVPGGWMPSPSVIESLCRFSRDVPRWALNGWCSKDEHEHLS